MYRLAIAGAGYNVMIIGVCFAEAGHQVSLLDIDVSRMIDQEEGGGSLVFEPDLLRLVRKHQESGRLKFNPDYDEVCFEADAIFIGGREDIPAEQQFINLASILRRISDSSSKDCLVAVQATTPVGTCDQLEQFFNDLPSNGFRMEIVSNPQFFSKGTAIRDTLYAGRIVIGTESNWAQELLTLIYKPFRAPMIKVSRKSAEMIKLAANNYLAVKLSYMNELANLCELSGADIDEVTLGMSYDERIGNRYLGVGIGYGGYGIPSDTKTLMELADSNEYAMKMVKAANEVNQEQKLTLYKKAQSRLSDFRGKKIAVLGLTYKPGTDDCMEAPSIDNIRLLLEEGADIWAYDPVGISNFKKLFPEGRNSNGYITYTDNSVDALIDAEGCFIFTGWGKIKAIRPDMYRKLMKVPMIFDGRNLYSVEDMQRAGAEYYSVGRKETMVREQEQLFSADLIYSRQITILG